VAKKLKNDNQTAVGGSDHQGFHFQKMKTLSWQPLSPEMLRHLVSGRPSRNVVGNSFGEAQLENVVASGIKQNKTSIATWIKLKY